MTLRALLLAAALGLVACEAPQPEAPPAPADTAAVTPPEAATPVDLEGVDDLVGDWLVTEKPGTAPAEGPSVVTFTRTGEYTVRDDAGLVQSATYRLVGEHRIAITDSVGTHEYDYAREGSTLLLTAPGTESTTVMERR